MKSAAERLLAQCPWKEFKAENGKVNIFVDISASMKNMKPQSFSYQSYK